MNPLFYVAFGVNTIVFLISSFIYLWVIPSNPTESFKIFGINYKTFWLVVMIFNGLTCIFDLCILLTL